MAPVIWPKLRKVLPFIQSTFIFINYGTQITTNVNPNTPGLAGTHIGNALIA